jgi:hypothetical protein
LSDCLSLVSVIFESGSRLERIEEMAFSGSALQSIVIPSSVVVLAGWSFCECRKLETVAFETGSRLQRVGKEVFRGSRLHSIVIPPGVPFIDSSAFNGTSIRL